MGYKNRITAALFASAMAITAMTADLPNFSAPVTLSAYAESISDMPSDFQYAADWIWKNRIEREQSTVRRNTIFDQIVAGKGSINYVVKWQSYRTVTYEQRQQFEKMLSDCINAWNDWLAGYENWPYEHIDVKVVGWAVIDKNCLLDLHDDEVVYTDTRYYNAQYDTSNGRDTIPDKEPFAPSELSRFDHFTEKGYEYPGGLDNRFDMYMWATQGFPDIGGCGGDWGQRLSDTAYLSMIQHGSLHVLEHEIGHGFGMTDFYGGEGESDGFPPGGFPGGENSIMMAGSAAKITDFDGWMLRYMWTKIKDDKDRFDLANALPSPPQQTDAPSYEGELITGDVDANGKVEIADAVLLQKWLLRMPDTYLPYWKAADICQDNKLDAFDLCQLRHMLVYDSEPTADSSPLIPATVSKFGKMTPSTGDCKMLSVFVEFADQKYSRPLSAETVKEKFFGHGNKNYPDDSISDWYERASYGNLHIDGDVYYYTLPRNMSDYMNDDRSFEDFAMEVLSGLDSQINYADYDANNDGIIDCLSIGVPLDNADEALKEYWWGCTAVWWDNPYFSLDGKKLNKYIILDVSPYSDTIGEAKSVLEHEMGHSLGLPDYYLYEAGDDWEGYKGDAGFERMDDSIGDFSSFSKLMYGWLREDEVQWFSGGTQSFRLKDSSAQGSCLIVPITSEVGDITSEYFLVEYVTQKNNNTEASWYTRDSGIRIFHINAELQRDEWSGLKDFKYGGYSEYYLGNDRFRVTRLVNEGHGFYHTGDICSYGTKNFAGYDSNGYQTIDTGITIEIGELKNGEYTVTVRK